jgi:hypothetical protein
LSLDVAVMEQRAASSLASLDEVRASDRLRFSRYVCVTLLFLVLGINL